MLKSRPVGLPARLRSRAICRSGISREVANERAILRYRPPMLSDPLTFRGVWSQDHLDVVVHRSSFERVGHALILEGVSPNRSTLHLRDAPSSRSP
jgi:hypothetical protein